LEPIISLAYVLGRNVKGFPIFGLADAKLCDHLSFMLVEQPKDSLTSKILLACRFVLWNQVDFF
jgi:hypothetical protein